MLRLLLRIPGQPPNPDDIARASKGAKPAKVAELLATLADVGQARATADGRYAA